MKLVVAVVQDYDTGRLLTALSEERIGATRIASAGGFLRAGNTTILIGVEDERLPTALGLIERTCRRRSQTDVASIDLAGLGAFDVSESRIGGGIALVATVERFERILPEVGDAEPSRPGSS